MSDGFSVQSHTGPYSVEFDDDGFARLAEADGAGVHVIIDDRVATLYEEELAPALANASVLRLQATEVAKSLEHFPGYVEHLVANQVRRGQVLVAIGGGIIQDITCFLAATLLRGLEWRFFPTTLLAQADSCIGSKSSINVGDIKNILGTFTPPRNVVVVPHVLETLSDEDVRSGIGEMLKVHAIEGPASFDRIAADYDDLLRDREVLVGYIRRSLEIKRGIIELDEFDRGPRNVMNYGHSFGHAIESATHFGVPHGIAITIGMDMANWVAAGTDRAPRAHYERMHRALAANYRGYEETEIPAGALLQALRRDKKNRAASLRLVLPDAEGRVGLVDQEPDEHFESLLAEYLAGERTS